MCLYASTVSWLDTGGILTLPYMGISTIGILSSFFLFNELKQYFSYYILFKFMVYL
jgi:hypothetical protein